MSKTRWHAYLDAFRRYAKIHDRLEEWIVDCADECHTEDLQLLLLGESEISDLNALSYVLLLVKQHDAAAQSSSDATGLIYLRNLQSLLDRLATVAKDHTARSDHEVALIEAFDTDKAVVDLQPRTERLIGTFAGLLREEIVKRFKAPQILHLQVLGFFDPMWALNLPRWLWPSNTRAQTMRA